MQTCDRAQVMGNFDIPCNATHNNGYQQINLVTIVIAKVKLKL